MRENRGSEFLIGEKNGSGETKGENVDRSIDRCEAVGWLRTTRRDGRQRTMGDDDDHGRKRRRNRRYAYMAMSSTSASVREYFSVGEMRRRAPEVFDAIVGIRMTATTGDDDDDDDDGDDAETARMVTVGERLAHAASQRTFEGEEQKRRELDEETYGVSGGYRRGGASAEDEERGGGETRFGDAFAGSTGARELGRDMRGSTGKVSEASWRKAMFEGWGAPDADASAGRRDESERDDDDTTDAARSVTQILDLEDYRASAGRSTAFISQDEYASRLVEFERAMRERFLAGEERDFDYSVVDADASLDDFWGKEARQDAEDRYFDDD